MMKVTIEDLVQVIGEQTVELAMLRREVARVTAQTAPAPGPAPLARVSSGQAAPLRAVDTGGVPIDES
jgi:hypothetical protein